MVCFPALSQGFAPYNPRKKNQDALVMAEDARTGTLFLVVLDGHGEAGDKVAQVSRSSTQSSATESLHSWDTM